jgi:hypothetical protein
MNIIRGNVLLRFGQYNYRPLNIGEGKKLYLSMLENGIQRFDVKNAIPLIVKKSYVDLDTLTIDTRPQSANFKEIEWTTAAQSAGLCKVIAPGGRHRHFAVQTYCEPMKRDFDRLEGIQVAVAMKHEPTTAKYLGAKAKKELSEKVYHDAALWLVSVYDEGPYLLRFVLVLTLSSSQTSSNPMGMSSRTFCRRTTTYTCTGRQRRSS